MKIGLIGTNWGRIHCGTFAEWGYKINTVMGQDKAKTKKVAKEEGIENYTTNRNDLKNMDVIIIASPMETHPEYIEFFKDKWVFCEKPLSGQKVKRSFIKKFKNKNIFFNYAFPQLETAKEIKRTVKADKLGNVYKIIANIAVSFPFEQSNSKWFVDVASHELYFFNYLFKRFNLKNHYLNSDRLDISTQFSNGKQSLNINLYQAYRESLTMDFKLIGDKGELEVNGGYIPDKDWNFSPLRLNGEAITEGEYSNEIDIWFRANARNVKLFLDLVNSKLSKSEAVAKGLADLTAAAEIEQGLNGLI